MYYDYHHYYHIHHWYNYYYHHIISIMWTFLLNEVIFNIQNHDYFLLWIIFIFLLLIFESLYYIIGTCISKVNYSFHFSISNIIEKSQENCLTKDSNNTHQNRMNKLINSFLCCVLYSLITKYTFFLFPFCELFWLIIYCTFFYLY